MSPDNTDNINSREATSGDEVVWSAQEGSQEIFLECSLFEVLYEGTRGPGKTDALIMDFCQHVGHGYGAEWRGILFRQTYPQLQDVINKTLKWIPRLFPDAKYNSSLHFWKFGDGEIFYLRQFDKERDYWNYHGHEYPWIGWEELCNWPSDAGYKKMMSCCRSTLKDMPRKYRATTNPYGPGHNWVKSRFRLPAMRFTPIMDSMGDDGKVELPRVAVHGSIYENKILLAADPEYIQKISAAADSDAERQAWLKGSWDIVAGGMLDDVWDQRVHVFTPFKIPENWKIYRSFDWGSSKPFSVGWHAESDGSDVRLSSGRWMSTVRGDTFRIAEWYGWNGKPNKGLKMLAVEVSAGIVDREVRMGYRIGSGDAERVRVKAGPADSSIYNVENGVSIGLDMEKSVRLEDGSKHKGARFTHADKRPGSRKTGWEAMRKMLKNAKKPKSGVRENPGYFVFSNCTNFLRTMPVLPRCPKDMDDVDTDAEDHIADEVRYLIRSLGNRVGAAKTTGMV